MKRNAEDAKCAEEDAEQVKRLISSAPLSANLAFSAFRLKWVVKNLSLAGINCRLLAE